MALEQHEVTDFSGHRTSTLAVEPDNDLDLPILDLTTPMTTGSLAAPPLELAAPAVVSASVKRGSKLVVETPTLGRAFYWIAGLATVLWLALSFYAMGYQGLGSLVDLPPYQMAVFVVFTVTPIGFFWIAAYCVRQGAQLATEAAKTHVRAKDMLEPAALAASEATSVVESVRHEIQAAADAANGARAELLSLRQALAAETERLTEAAEQSARAAGSLAEKLSTEREAMSGLASTLDQSAAAVAEAITRQATMVSEASDLAQVQIGEAEAALAARATDLAAAAGDASDASRLASEDLARQVSRLETATIGVGDQIRTMEDTLTQQRAALVSVAHAVRADHEDFSIRVETQQAQLTEIIANAQHGVATLNESAASAAEALGELTTSATTQATELANTAKAERDFLAASALQSLSAVAEAARMEREGLSGDVDSTLRAISNSGARERGSLEEALRAQLASLAELAHAEHDALEDGLRSHLDAMTALARSERATLDAEARRTLQEVGAMARSERETLQVEALGGIEAVGAMARSERDELKAEALHGVEAVGAASRTQREALQAEAIDGLQKMTEAAETASQLAEGYNDAAHRKMDDLTKKAFAANQQAEQVFQARLNEANTLISRSSDLVDEAAVRSAERIEQATARARAMLDGLVAAVADFERRASTLPIQVQAQADQLRATLESGFDGLLASARAASEETQAIDAAFQERVRRNYEMLSEAVRLMGVVANRPSAAPAPTTLSPALAPRPAPSPPPRVEAAAAPPAPDPLPATPPAPAAARPPALAGKSAAAGWSADAAGLRPRLKLEPTSADAEVSQVFEPASDGGAQADTGGWTWQELLSSMDGEGGDDPQLMDRLIGEIESLGADLGALLPPARIDEIAAVIEAGDAAGARKVVRHLAPAAIRRLSRRALAEKSLRGHAERFVGRYAAALDEAASHKGRGGSSVAGLLSTEGGRTFLLYDAALGDLP